MTNKLKIINDPIHGFIKIPHEILFDVIEHPYFQRLRRISQTGLLNLVFPGATHTRFHHALGAMCLMFKALEILRMKGVMISKEEEKAALLAILLHDIGHGPYSHALENILMDKWHHERISILLMKRLNEEFSGELSLAIEMFLGRYYRPFFSQLISSQIDVDRLDYLKRDSFYTGVAEGNINVQRVISMLNVHEEKLVIDSKGIYSVEHFLTSRMFMYWQVYFHKTVVAIEFLLVKILSRAKEMLLAGTELHAPDNLQYFLNKNNFEQMSEKDIDKFTKLDDADILQTIKSWVHHDDFVLSYLCKSIINRHLPKPFSSFSPFSDELIQHKIEEVNILFSIENGEKLVGTIVRELLPYHENKQPIELISKTGEIHFFHTSRKQLILRDIYTTSIQYILIFPRELS